MREDLLDAYGAIDWAVSQLPVLEQTFKAWFDAPPYLLVEEPHPEMGKKLFKLEINRELPATANAAVGAIINSIRTSLDILAASLARRNGKSPNADRHFPIYLSIMGFIDPLEVLERKKWLSERERGIIEGLKPYDGGHDLLFPLHQLDIVRKHDRLIRAKLVPSMVTVSPEVHRQGLEFPAAWPGFEDGAVIAWTNIDATESDFHIAAEVAFNETKLIGDRPVGTTLRQFAGAANSIIQLFE